MATTTPNYGWSVPTSTDLVKDGATAIETLGDSADATVKALNPETTLGDIAYRSSTSNTNTRLGIGSSAQVLTVAGGVPTWATPAAAASGLTLVTTGTYSASAGVSLNSIFTSTYTNYRVMFVGTISSNNDVRIRWRAAGTDNTASNYLWGIQGITFGGSAANEYAGAALVGFSQIGYQGNNGQSHIVLDIFNPQASLNTTYAGQNLYTSSGTAGNFYQTQGLLSVTTSYDGLTFYPAAGTITGSYWVYGYQKA